MLTLDVQDENARSAGQAKLALDFVVVGGGISGLTVAVALRRVGHRVTLLERDASFDRPEDYRGCVMGVNMTKVFYHWGLKAQLKRFGPAFTGCDFVRYENGFELGSSTMNHDLFDESQGRVTTPQFRELRQFFVGLAKQFGVVIRLGAEAVSVSNSGTCVTLASGETISADVIVGATGRLGFTRDILSEGEAPSEATQYMLFNAIIPGDAVCRDPMLRKRFFKDGEVLGQELHWWGDNRSALLLPSNDKPDYSLHIVVPDDGSAVDGYGEIVDRQVVAAHVTNCDRSLQELIPLADSFLRHKVMNSPILEDWVHPSGRFVGVGQAVHPFLPGPLSMHGNSMSAEDASLFAKLFSHLSSKSQISSFLYAFEEIRMERVAKIRAVEYGSLRLFCLPDGEEAQVRDRAMHEQWKAGKDPFRVDDADDTANARFAETVDIWTYDAEDEAEDWWVTWGMLRLRAQKTNLAKSIGLATKRSSPMPVNGVS